MLIKLIDMSWLVKIILFLPAFFDKITKLLKKITHLADHPRVAEWNSTGVA